MWVMILFDLPTETKRERKISATFRKKLIEYGFTMFQFSIYLRHCPSKENAEVQIKRIKKNLPETGNVGIICVTDKQFGMMELFYGHEPEAKQTGWQQLELF